MKSKMGDKQRLEHMLAVLTEIDSFVFGVTRQDFNQDRKTLFACVRGLEILGEASRHVSDHTKEQFQRFLGIRLPLCATLLSINTL